MSNAGPPRTAPRLSQRLRNRGALMVGFSESPEFIVGQRSLSSTAQSSSRATVRPVEGRPGILRRGSMGRRPQLYAPAYSGCCRMFRSVVRLGRCHCNCPRSGPWWGRTPNWMLLRTRYPSKALTLPSSSNFSKMSLTTVCTCWSGSITNCPDSSRTYPIGGWVNNSPRLALFSRP